MNMTNVKMITPTVIRDCFVESCDDLIRHGRDLAQINMRLQRAIVAAEADKSEWMNDLLDIKQRVNTNFHRRFGV